MPLRHGGLCLSRFALKPVTLQQIGCDWHSSNRKSIKEQNPARIPVASIIEHGPLTTTRTSRPAVAVVIVVVAVNVLEEVVIQCDQFEPLLCRRVCVLA